MFFFREKSVRLPQKDLFQQLFRKEMLFVSCICSLTIMASEPLNKVLYFENDLSVKKPWVYYVQWCFCSLLSKLYPFPKGFHIFNGFLFTLSFPTPWGANIQTSKHPQSWKFPVWMTQFVGAPLFPEAKCHKIPMQPDTTLDCSL